ncbi:hypothetical protein MTBBW1_520021 [Desulfamplus magnetovallimortis]|uniref:Uncharacterized protein n=1 Tax=Desulfamplus magnetovallimortis TaxID=1246637 RepID=A0A1W1HHP0_9BACT|nr:hypothetical protein MTBBW1_520021 [Desulfamplus magnetovallimortis]
MSSYLKECRNSTSSNLIFFINTKIYKHLKLNNKFSISKTNLPSGTLPDYM